jgi:ferrous iron transport protein A
MTDDPARDDETRLVRLADGRRGLAGVIAAVCAPDHAAAGIDADELERRLLEMGFVEGARVEILHEGFIRRDPICVRLDDMRVALRRREARGVMILPDRPA